MTSNGESKFSIERADASDSDGILECLREAFEPYRESYTPGAFLDTVLTPQKLADRLATMSVFVARDADGHVIGTIGCNRIDTEEGHIRGMAVRPAWHGHGVAEKLLQAAESELRRSGCCRVTLDTTKPLQRAMSFYQNHGYHPTGRISDFFGMPLYEYVKEIV